MTLKKIVKDIGIVGIGNILIKSSGIILLPVLTRTLGAYGYGIWVQALATMGLVTTSLTLGLPHSIGRFFPAKKMLEIREDFYSILTVIIITASLFSIILYSYPTPLANAILDGNTIVVRMVSIIILVRCLDSLFKSVFRAFREMKKYSILNVSRTFLQIGLAISLVLLGYGIFGALFAVLLSNGILLLLEIMLVSKKIPYHTPNFSALKEYLNFGIPSIPSSLSYWVIETSDRYLIGFFLGATFVGYYSPGYSLGKIVPFMIIGVLSPVLTPSLSSYYSDGNISMVKKVLNLCIKYFLVISIPFFVGAILLGRSLLLLLTTPKIAQEAYIILFFSGIAAIFYGIKVMFQKILVLKKMMTLNASFYFVAAIVNLIGNIYLIPQIGITGAGITTIISYFIALILTIYFGRKEIAIKPDYMHILKVILSAIGMGILVYYTKAYFSSNFFFLTSIGIISYFIVLYSIGGIKKKEIDFIKGMIR